jgi:signal transduction histidine kinase
MDFSAVAHDLRTPLNVMLGQMQLLSVEQLSESGRRRLRVLQTQVQRMMRLLDGCSDDDHAARFTPVDVAVLVHDVVAELDAIFEPRGIEIISNIDGSLPLLAGDSDLLHRVLINLLTNAADAIAGEGRVEIKAWVQPGLTRDAESVHIEITDTGAGIPAEVLARVFEYGFTTKARGQSHGLGLSICREIMHLHGGQIRLLSVPGRGTTVSLSLPF